jgi:type III secretory pathway component EscT
VSVVPGSATGWPLPALILATALGAARATPVVWLVTPLGGPRLTPAVRVGFALLLAALAAPILIAAPGVRAATAAIADDAGAGALVRLTLLMGRELLVGLTLGLVVSAAFRGAEAAGRLADTLRGANIAEVLVPTAEERSSPLGALYLLLATVVFFQIGGVHRLVEALMESYRALPVGERLQAIDARRAAFLVVTASAKLIAAGLALAAPVVVALWLTDLALGLIARAAPQVPVYFIGLPLKGLLAIGVVLVGLGGLQGALAAGFGDWLRLGREAWRAFQR